VPNEVRYPGPLSQLLCTGCSLGRVRHRTASRFSAAVEREETHGFEVFPQPGLRASFPGERRRGASVHDRATRVPAGDERAGRVLVTSLGTKPIPASYGLCASFRPHYAKMSSRVSAARNLAAPPRTKSPVVASSSPAGTHVARPSTIEARPVLLANQDCPHFLPAEFRSHLPGAPRSPCKLRRPIR